MKVQNGLHSLSHILGTMPTKFQTKKKYQPDQPLTNHMELVFIVREDISTTYYDRLAALKTSTTT
jgi:hypothetical protein